MASDLIKWGLIGVAGWYVYTNFLSAPATAPAPVGPAAPATTPPADTPPAPPPYQYTPPTTLQALKTAAGGNSATADVWNFYYGAIPGKHALVEGFDAVFFPNGRPPDPANTPKISAEAYLTGIGTKGLSGLGRMLPHHLTAPAMNSIARARSIMNSGGKSSYVRAGSRMPAGGR